MPQDILSFLLLIKKTCNNNFDRNIITDTVKNLLKRSFYLIQKPILIDVKISKIPEKLA